MSDIQHRLIYLREQLGFNQSKFAEILDIKRPTLIGYETGKAPPSSELMLAVHDRFGVNINWLLFGEGEMLNCSTFQSPNAEIESRNDIIPPSSSEPGTLAPIPRDAIPFEPIQEQLAVLGNKILLGYPKDVTVYKYQKGNPVPVEIHSPDPEGVVFVPIYSQRAAAGPGQESTQLVETEGSLPVLYELFGPHDPKNCGLVRVVGDSMSDIALFDGDWAIFDRRNLKGDGIFVIAMYGEMRVKRLQYRLVDRRIIISSENVKRYPDPESVPVDAIEQGNLIVYGRVFSWFHKHPY